MTLTPFTTATVNPQNIALLNRAPYLTVSEFQFAPTALDLSNLVSPGYEVDQSASLAQIIARACSAIDSYVFPLGTGGTLSASVDTDTGSMKVRPDGYLPLSCRFAPVLAVTAMSLGGGPSSLEPIAEGVAADIIIDGKMLFVPASLGLGNTTSLFGPQRGPGGRVYAVWSYVNGYPHTILAAAATEGDLTLTVGNTLGMFPGTTLSIYDGAKAEDVTVDTVDSATEFTVTEPLAYSHAVPTAPDALSVSALPGAVKQAAIDWTASLIHARGDNALVLPDSSQSNLSDAHAEAKKRYESAAKQLLDPYRIVRGDK